MERLGDGIGTTWERLWNGIGTVSYEGQPAE